MKADLFELVLSVLAVILSVYILPYLRTKAKNEETKKVLADVERIVLAVEQTAEVKGPDKLATAVDVLRRDGYEIDASLVEHVEAAVQRLCKK